MAKTLLDPAQEIKWLTCRLVIGFYSQAKLAQQALSSINLGTHFPRGKFMICFGISFFTKTFLLGYLLRLLSYMIDALTGNYGKFK